jgi:hypothetical protein
MTGAPEVDRICRDLRRDDFNVCIHVPRASLPALQNGIQRSPNTGEGTKIVIRDDRRNAYYRTNE